MKKIFLSINGERHEVVDLKIRVSGYHGHNLAMNQRHLESIDYVYIVQDYELLSKDEMKDIKESLNEIDGGES